MTGLIGPWPLPMRRMTARMHTAGAIHSPWPGGANPHEHARIRIPGAKRTGQIGGPSWYGGSESENCPFECSSQRLFPLARGSQSRAVLTWEFRRARVFCAAFDPFHRSRFAKGAHEPVFAGDSGVAGSVSERPLLSYRPERLRHRTAMSPLHEMTGGNGLFSDEVGPFPILVTIVV